MNNPHKPLEIHDLTVSYQRKPVLYGIDLEIEEGSLVGVIGLEWSRQVNPRQDNHEYGQTQWRTR